MGDAFFDHPGAFLRILTVIGVGLSAYDVLSAYQQGEVQGNQEVVRQVFSWGGAIAGAELVAAIGTAIFPGVGTVIGAFVGGGLGGSGGDWLANQLLKTPLPGFVYYLTPGYGKGRANPI